MLERQGVITELEGFMKNSLFLEVESAQAELALDSIGIVNLLLHVEQTYNVTLPMHEIELEDLATVARIAGLVLRYAGVVTEAGAKEGVDGHPNPAV